MQNRWMLIEGNANGVYERRETSEIEIEEKGQLIETELKNCMTLIFQLKQFLLLLLPFATFFLSMPMSH
jgi:hypothetical protein